MKAIIVAGPSASGKSKLAVKLAQALNGEIINADSMQVYEPLHILTARPDMGNPFYNAIRHHLYGVLSGFETGSVAWWYGQACQIIANIIQRGKTPVIVGGTGLYIKALTDGLSKIPQTPPELRQQVEDLWNKSTPEDFAAQVYKIDQNLAQKIKPFDKQRLIRAWEVFLMTGQSILALQKSPEKILDLNCTTILLKPDREKVYQLVNLRLEEMVRKGAIEEVEKLLNLNLPSNSPILKAVGVPELASYLKKEIPLEEAIIKAQRASRQYVKRQYTWFNHQLDPNDLICVTKIDDDLSVITKHVETLLTAKNPLLEKCI